MNIGLLLSISFAPHRRILRGIRRYVETRPDWVLTSVTREQLARQGRHLRLDGIIAAVTSSQIAKLLSPLRPPAVNIQAILPVNALPRVGVDNHLVGQLAAEHFLEIGLRSFAFVGPADTLFSLERKAGFCRTIGDAGFTAVCHENRVRQAHDPLGQRWDLQRSVEAWLRKLAKPVGVFAANDLWGLQLGEACRRAGLRVPEDVALLGVGNDELFCEMSRPPLSSIGFQAERIGHEAAALLSRILAGEPRPAEPILFPPSGIIIRQSSDILAIDDNDVANAIRYLREHAHERVTIGDVVRRACIGRRTLERRFRRTTGRGIADEIRRLRLERACRLLIETELPMQGVALQSGFSGLRHLSEAFRNALDMPPTAYRARMRREEA